MSAAKKKAAFVEKEKSLETWIWDAACSIRVAKDAPKYKDFILPLIFTKRIADTLIGWKEEETAKRDSAPKITEGKSQSVPEGQDKLSRIVRFEELKKNDYNISPSRYIHTGDAETYRPIGEIVATARRDSANQQTAGKPQSLTGGQDNLDAIEAEARETDKALRKILNQLGV